VRSVTERIKLQEFVAGIMESKLENYCQREMQVITLVPVRLQKGMYDCLSAVCIMTGTDLGRTKIQCVQNISVLKGLWDP
jgi:hypothetical protein